jgi:hypothetical protein
MTIESATAYSPISSTNLVFEETNTHGTPTDVLPIDTASLSPEALMAYCQSRLDSIEGQVKSTFLTQEARNGETAAVQQVLATLQKYSSGVAGGDSAGASKCADMEKAFHALITQLKSSGAPCSDLGKLEQAYNDLVYTGTGPTTDLPYVDPGTYPPNQRGPQGDNVIDSEEMTGFIGTLQGCVNDLNSGSDLQMIQLQSLMSERQTAISLTTNLVQSLDDTLQKVAENIGH